jgi:thiamine transporter ThiT
MGHLAGALAGLMVGLVAYWRTERWKGCDDITGFSHMGHLAGALAGLIVGLVTLENRKVEGL